jgi:hypothetical protein|tara:strand:+ start:321 stop:572 length:252 start_codon:yes stop_codon:yes gene_type:complete
MKTIVHVNQHKIRANNNKDLCDLEPVLTVKTYKSNDYAYQAIIKDDNGEEVARVVYSPHKPLSCGARVWVETQNEVEVLHDAP